MPSIASEQCLDYNPCLEHQEFPSILPSKFHQGPMLPNPSGFKCLVWLCRPLVIDSMWCVPLLSVFPVDTTESTDMLNYLLWLCFSPFALKTLMDLNFLCICWPFFVCCTLRQLTKKYFYELDFVFFQFCFPLMIFCSLYLSNCTSFVFLSYSSLVDHYSRTTPIKPTNGQLSISFQAEKYKA